MDNYYQKDLAYVYDLDFGGLSPHLFRPAHEKLPGINFIQSSIYDFDFPPSRAICLIGEIVRYDSDGPNKWERVEKFLRKA